MYAKVRIGPTGLEAFHPLTDQIINPANVVFGICCQKNGWLQALAFSGDFNDQLLHWGPATVVI